MKGRQSTGRPPNMGFLAGRSAGRSAGGRPTNLCPVRLSSIRSAISERRLKRQTPYRQGRHSVTRTRVRRESIGAGPQALFLAAVVPKTSHWTSSTGDKSPRRHFSASSMPRDVCLVGSTHNVLSCAPCVSLPSPSVTAERNHWSMAGKVYAAIPMS